MPQAAAAETPPWAAFADVVLQRAALTARAGWDRVPDPLAGFRVDDDQVEALLAQLPGLDRLPPPESADAGTPGDRTVAADASGWLSELDVEVERARAVLARATGAGDPATGRRRPDAFAALVGGIGAGPGDTEVLALLCAVEADPRRQRLVGYLNDDVTLKRLTPWTLAALLDRDALLAVSPTGVLRRACLLTPAGTGPWAADALAVEAAVMWWLTGSRSGDAGPPSLPPDPHLPPGATLGPGGDGSATLVVVAGPDRTRRLSAASAALAGCVHLRTPHPADREQWDAVVRHATLAGAGVVVELGDGLTPEGRARVEQATHLAWALSCREELAVASLPARPWLEVEPAPPVVDRDEWAAAFDGRVPDGAEAYRLTADQLGQVATTVGAVGGDLRRAVRRLAAGHIDATATRLRPRRGWDDLILDPERSERVREIAIRCRQRDTVFGDWGLAPEPSTGVVALFAGPSGTGKTLAAEVVAGDLGVDLFKVDLANMVSKYIGETEKNLSAVFDAAEASGVALFFDEADALLGKRSEVADAHDRYANIEVAFLLQRLERYDGLAVMATNLAKNLDPAFLRRIHVIVEFQVPEAPERRRIWGRCLPPGAPLDPDLDLDGIAREVELAGGAIRNAVATAAFLAAEEGTPIGNRHVALGLRRELQKLGRLVSGADMAAWFDLPR